MQGLVLQVGRWSEESLGYIEAKFMQQAQNKTIITTLSLETREAQNSELEVGI